MQPIIDALDNWAFEQRKQRAETQMTLGQLIEILAKQPFGKQIENIVSPHSFRTINSDLAFRRKTDTRSVKSLLKSLRNRCIDKYFKAYSGGYYLMDANTPLWISESPKSMSGERIIAIVEGDILSFETEKLP